MSADGLAVPVESPTTGTPTQESVYYYTEGTLTPKQA